MPIKPENRSLYPPDWPAIRDRILRRAGWRCECGDCKARQYSVGVWEKRDDGTFVWGPLWGQNDNPRTYAEARQVAADEHWSRFGDEIGDVKIIVIVLTIAHLNHDPTDCRPENLAAMCQRHHLAHDHALHMANSQATRRAKSGTLELF